MASLGHPANFNGFCVLAALLHGTSSGRQPNFAALNRGRHLYSAGRQSRWALAHISSYKLSIYITVVLIILLTCYSCPNGRLNNVATLHCILNTDKIALMPLVSWLAELNSCLHLPKCAMHIEVLKNRKASGTKFVSLNYPPVPLSLTLHLYHKHQATTEQLRNEWATTA